jgi:electron transfer flavoprotein alpha subunit/quercetin dioxygenase-like cupin family protein
MTETKGKEIWVYMDLRAERFFGYGLNVLAKASDLAGEVSGKAAAVMIGSPVHDGNEGPSGVKAFMDGDAAARRCIAHGAGLVYVLQGENLDQVRADTFGSALAATVQSRNPLLVLFPMTDFSRELAARAARICNVGLIADCSDFKVENNLVVATSPSWGGEIMIENTFAEDQSTGFATVQPHAFKAAQLQGEPGRVERISTDPVKRPKGLKLLSSILQPAEHRRLEEAEVVVVGGAGLGNVEGFSVVRELAAALGGEVGATRPPVLQHWVDEERLIGQTGKTVRPRLLFSIGTSGAVQYTAGITEAETIVAINRDQHAPIFAVADIGVVGDAKTFVPLLTAKVKGVIMRRLADVLSEGREEKAKAGFGAQVVKLREAHQWSRETLAKATAQSPDFIEQVEKDQLTPSVSFLLTLARALGVDPATFLHDEEKTMVRDKRAQAFAKRTQNYSYETLTPGAENQHLRAFKITIEPRQAHKPVAYKHEGEEFILVMEGNLELTLGGKAHHLKPGESMHFNSETPHKLKSVSDQPTRCVVVLYTP